MAIMNGSSIDVRRITVDSPMPPHFILREIRIAIPTSRAVHFTVSRSAKSAAVIRANTRLRVNVRCALSAETERKSRSRRAVPRFLRAASIVANIGGNCYRR